MTEAFLEPVTVCAIAKLPQIVRDKGFFLLGRLSAKFYPLVRRKMSKNLIL